MIKKVTSPARPTYHGRPTPRPRQECDICGKSIIFYKTSLVCYAGEFVKVIVCDKCEREGKKPHAPI